MHGEGQQNKQTTVGNCSTPQSDSVSVARVRRLRSWPKMFWQWEKLVVETLWKWAVYELLFLAAAGKKHYKEIDADNDSDATTICMESQMEI